MKTYLMLMFLGLTVNDPYAKAYQEFKESNKPLVVLVTTNDCAPCEILKTTLSPWKSYKDRILVEVTLDHNFAKSLKLDSAPHLFYFSQKGYRLKAGHDKTTPLEQLELQLQRLLDQPPK